MKRSVLLSMLLMLGLSIWAQQITEQQARARVLKYLKSDNNARTRGMAAATLTPTKTDAKSIYAFNLDRGGYVIASGDSRALPVLGYSTTGSIDWDRMPDNMKAWLKSYDQAIASLGDNKDFVDGKSTLPLRTRAARPAIQPLIKTQWDQDAPYWNMTPPYDGANPDWQGLPSLTGCVATAMAMIMHYYQWPKDACAEIPAYDIPTAHENVEKIWHIDALPPTTFDWDNMLDNYVDGDKILGTEEQQDAVAKLMRYCGQAAYMEYSPEGSGVDDQNASEALIKYFGYKNTARNEWRVKYTIDGWEELIYNELADGHPVLYGAYNDESGHEFICDGYDGNGFFHINWGWGGIDNNYYALSVLNDNDYRSTDINAFGLGFCINQDAIVGIQPDTEGNSTKVIYPTVRWNLDYKYRIHEPDTTVFTFSVDTKSYDYDELRMDYAMGTLDTDGKIEPVFMGDKADSLVYDVNSCYVKIDSTVFAPGENMRLYPMIKLRSIPTADWQMIASTNYYVIAGRTAEGRFYLTKELPELEITNIEITKGCGRLYTINDMKVTVKNHSNIEFTPRVVLVPYYYGDVKPEDITDDTPFSEGEEMNSQAYIKANDTVDIPFSFKPMNVGTVYMKLYTVDSEYLGSGFMQVTNVAESYDRFLINNSTLEMTDKFEGVYHVSISDNPDEVVPHIVPGDRLMHRAYVSDVNDQTYDAEVVYKQEARDYLKALPEKAGQGNYTLQYDMPFELSRGGWYYVKSCFIDEINNSIVLSVEHEEEFCVEDAASIRVLGDTILASGEPIDLEIQINSGYPWAFDGMTGLETATIVLNRVGSDGELSQIDKGEVPITFANGDEYLAGVDTIHMKSVALADGVYQLHVSTGALGIPSRTITIAIGTTAINGIISTEPDKQHPYYDLRGMRTDRRPLRRGLYIRNGRKVIR